MKATGKILILFLVCSLFKVAHAENEPNNRFEEAENIPINVSVNGEVSDRDDIDVFAFDLTEPSNVRLLIEQDFPEDLSWSVGLYSAADPDFISAQNPLQVDDIGEFDNAYYQMGLPAGRYFVVVEQDGADFIVGTP